MNVTTIVGARPQFVKAALASEALAAVGVHETLVHTGQHYDAVMSDVFFDELGLAAPEHNLGIGSASHGKQTGRMLSAIEQVLTEDRPDMVLVYGDTNSTLAGGLAAAKLHIPVAHVEAGLRSFNRRMPEEINRVLVDHLSDLLFAPTRTAVENLRREAVSEAHVHCVGDVMMDAAYRFARVAEARDLAPGNWGVTPAGYIFGGQFVQNHIYTPLFPIWAHLTGGGLGLRLADIALSTATVAIVYELTWTLSRSQAAALLAALFMALYPHFAFFTVARLSETLFIFLVCVALMLLYRQRYLTASVFLVLAILTRPALDYLAPCLIVLFSIVVHRETAATAVRRVALYAVVYAVLMAPWWWHNYQKYSEFIRLSLGDGIVLYSGNNPLNTSGGGVAGGPGGDDMDLSLFDHITDPIERNAAMKQAALQFIKENPGRFAELAVTKLVRTWRLWPYAPEFQKPHIIAASILSYGPVLALFLLSLVIVVPRHWRSCLPLLAFIGYLTLVHMVTIGSVRYRLPMEPFAIILAAMALHRLLAGMPVARPMLEWLDSDGRAPTAASS